MTWRKCHRNRRKQLRHTITVYQSYICDGVKTELPPFKMIWTHRRSYSLNELTFVLSHQVPLID